MKNSKKLLLSLGLLCLSQVALCEIRKESSLSFKVFGWTFTDWTLADSDDSFATGFHCLGCGPDLR